MTVAIEEIKKRFVDNEDVCHRITQTFALISNRTRFRILCMLVEGDFCVNDIADTVQGGKLSNISQQLRILTLAGVLEKTRRERKIIYHLRDPKIVNLIRFLQKEFT